MWFYVLKIATRIQWKDVELAKFVASFNGAHYLSCLQTGQRIRCHQLATMIVIDTATCVGKFQHWSFFNYTVHEYRLNNFPMLPCVWGTTIDQMACQLFWIDVNSRFSTRPGLYQFQAFMLCLIAHTHSIGVVRVHKQAFWRTAQNISIADDCIKGDSILTRLNKLKHICECECVSVRLAQYIWRHMKQHSVLLSKRQIIAMHITRKCCL